MDVETMMSKLVVWARNHPVFGRFANRGFFNYFWIGAAISISNVALLWVLIDVLGIPTIVSSVMVVGFTFVGRYLLFKRFHIS